MCLSPLNIRVRNKYFTPTVSSCMLATVPCGHCTECQFKKRDEYKFRIYYEFQRCIDNGGYVLSQALTYRESNVPKIKNFFHGIPNDLGNHYCFNRYHIRQFLMDLRNTLRRKYNINPAGHLKYFLAAEYGTSDEGTHRPHYHVLFFWDDESLLSWQQLSSIVEDTWKHGLSDGIKTKGRSYLANDTKPHIFLKGSKDFYQHELAIDYVTEYLVKDTYFYKEIEKRLNAFHDHLYNEGIPYSTIKEEFKKFRRYCCQFHLNSPHLGDNFLDFNSYEKVLSTGIVSMPSSNPLLPVITIPLPVYFKRKLFYDLIRDFDNSLKWIINDEGKKYTFTHYQNLSKTFCNKFHDIYQFQFSDCQRKTFDTLLGNRTINDFVDYLLLYHGRMITPRLYSVEEQLDSISTPLCADGMFRLYFGNVPTFSMDSHSSFYYTQNSNDKFKYFDELFYLFSSSQLRINEEKEKANLFQLQLKKRAKKLKT